MGGGTPRNASSGNKAGLERMKDHRVTTNLESVLFSTECWGRRGGKVNSKEQFSGCLTCHRPELEPQNHKNTGRKIPNV